MKTSIDPSATVLLFVVLRQAVRRGVPLGQALRSTAGETGIPREVLATLALEIEGGDALSEAMERRPEWFPAPLPALVAAGERSARLDETLARCVELLRRRDRTRASIGAALVYPAICVGLLVAMLALHAVFDPLGRVDAVGQVLRSHPAEDVLDSFDVPDVLAPRDATPLQDETAGRSAPSMRPWYVAALLVLLVSMGILRASPKLRDHVRLDLPVSGRLHRLGAAAGFTRALAALLERGAPIDTALAAAIPCAGNLWVETQLRQRLAAVSDGEGLASSLMLPGVFPPSLKWRLAVGEARGNFADVLDEAAAAYEDELDVRSARVARLIEPAALILVGGAAALVMIRVMPSNLLELW